MKRLIAGSALALAACGMTAGTANAEPAGSSTQDTTFFRLLTTPDDDGFFITVTNPSLLRTQGLAVCQRMDNGMDGLDAVYGMMADGPYPWDTANSISSAAVVAYCPEHLQD
ncbi:MULTISPECIES: DUF732 domain-containing protein [unclassified Mycolicibacterium]|uniref:DUF732 domain-containing protein n=1 Tax=unclassified Mycolicibacterium TaxID=2636767 RepID=UPI0012DDA197|nr:MULTISPECIES: DUF732 domain-containing protein [unclassified Mycolicibacterium]MUL80505.1 DUF732 domain-containing protein [Mycolicibacterium sp. CBMA 329]MUL86272.1 DUF732 domain-containing protein [Mycolicibacterium sp. CBMA 331]MUM01066.1 DUF732 domain-containing protein [Mycolicibacterium sp. CBMA 334]MUM24960.1 DUF732 domain-containing protein [Mycolicibacterium sp. CBMA 295]MUM36568.1 DUF732 domain-containing protein [Mycolicibacterium sp. CBMA 247]